MFKKLSIIAGIIFGIIILLLVIALISFRIIFPPEKIRTIASRQIVENFHRKIDAGNISVNLLKGLRINDIKISERPDFDSGVFIQSKKISTGISFIPLLKGDIIINQIKLTEPQINIVRFKNGEYNFTDMLSGLQIDPEKIVDEKKFIPVGLLISNILIARGKINYIDHTPIKISAEIDDIEIELSSLPFKKISKLSSTFEINIALRGVKFTASSALRGSFDMSKNRFQLTELNITTEEGSLKLSGEIYDFTKTPFVDLNMIIDKFFFSKIVKEFSASLWLQLKLFKSRQIELNIKGPLDKIEFTLIFPKSAMKLESGSEEICTGVEREQIEVN
jgi:AsmA protein